MDVSVVVASYNASGTIADCLTGLAGQEYQRTFEVIVTDSSSDRTPEIITERFPWVRLLRSPKHMYPGMARNMGVSAVKGRIVAFIDADCIPAPDWLERITRAHDQQHWVVGGGMVCSSYDSRSQLAYFFSEFSNWLPRSPARWVKDQPTANISYRRELFDRYGGFIERDYCSDTDFNFALQQQGHRIWFDPAIEVRHQNPSRFTAILRHQIEHGRAYGGWRLKSQRWSPLRRILYCTLLPAVIFKLTAQKTIQAVSVKRFRRLILKCWPWFMAATACWVLGESLAYMQRSPGTR